MWTKNVTIKKKFDGAFLSPIENSESHANANRLSSTGCSCSSEMELLYYCSGTQTCELKGNINNWEEKTNNCKSLTETPLCHVPNLGFATGSFLIILTIELILLSKESCLNSN